MANCLGYAAAADRTAAPKVAAAARDLHAPLTVARDVTQEVGQAVLGPVAAWVTGDVEHLAGRNAAGDLLVFWWSPKAGRWQVVNASREAGARIDSPVTAWVTRSGEFTVEHLAGRNAAGDLLVFWWSPKAGRWQVVNASTIAAGPAAAGALSALLPASGVDMLVARSEDDHLLQFWWSRTLDWQVCDLTRATGRGLASDPTVWLRPSGDGGRREGIAGCTSDAHLVVFTGDGAERGLTDGLQQPFLAMRPTRGARLKVLTILWDPHKPNVPRPTRASVEAAVLGATNSVRGYFLENSRGTFTIESAGVVGWYDSDHPPSEYWPGGGKVGRDSGAEAIRKAARDLDFASFDTNRDGKLDIGELFVLFVLPGRGDGGGLGRPVGDDYVPRGEGKGVVVDGVRIVTIAEVSIGSPPGPGIVAHELAHPLLELGDMYFGYFNPTAAGPYSLMDEDGRAPHIDPAHKLKLAWLRPQIVLRSGSYELPDVERSGLVLVLLDPRHGEGEYFIVENRWQGSSYDTALDFSGLAVWHVIEDRETYERFPPRDVPRKDWDNPDYKGWSRQGIRMIRPLRAAPFAATLPLWDGSAPATGYDLLSIDPLPAHASLRWADGTPSGFAVRQLSPAAAVMRFDVEVGSGGGRVVPTVMQMPRANAAKAITNAGLVPAFTGETGANAWVLTQSPRGGMLAAPGSTVTMRMRTGPIP